MKKRMLRSAGILVFTILYCLVVYFFNVRLWDAELSFKTADAASNGTVIQLFWDDGTGLTAEKSVYAQIDNQSGSCTFTKDQIGQILSYRIDPIAEEKDVEFTSIAINGREVDMDEFSGWIAISDQLEYEIRTDGESKSLYIHPTSMDPQLYMGEAFTKAMSDATMLPKVVRRTLILGGIAVAFILLFLKEILWLLDKASVWGEKKLEKLLSGKKGRQHVAALLGLLGICVFVFWKFLIGEKCFLFADASDQYGQYYPQLLEYARYIEKGLKYGSFDFSKALGDNVGLIKLNLNTWVCWFGQEHVGYLLGISQFLKVLGSGAAFYALMCVNGQKRWFSAILALGYAFCGHMTIRGSWGNYPNEILLVAIWLLCFELLIKRKDFRWLPLATWLFFYHFSSGYYMYLYVAVFTAYALFRIATEWRIPAKVWLAILGIGVVGCGTVFWVTKGSFLDGIVSALSSDRAQNNLEGFLWNLSSFAPSLDNWPVVFGRTIGLATLGNNGIDYIDDYWNFLEDPTFYCGILVLLLLPLAFYCMNWKKRIGLGMAYVAAFLICFSGQLRLALNGFSGSSYKLCTFWMIVVMLFSVGQIEWDKLKEGKKRRNSGIIVSITYIVLLGLTLELKDYIYVSERYYKLSILFLSLEFVGVLLLFVRPQIHFVVKGILVLVVGIEVFCMAYPIYNDRKTMDADIYWDDTMEALQYIADYDETFYRVDKQYQSVHYCDSLAQGYNGTAFYIGGMGPLSSIADFYHDMGLPIYSLNRVAWGTSSYNEVETLLGMRYILTKESDVANYGFEQIGITGDVSIYENKNALPMGFVYTKAIERSTFEKLPYNQRQRALLMAALVEDGTDVLPLLTEEEIAALSEKETLFDQYEVALQSAENYSFVFEPNTEEEVIAVQITFDGAGKSDLCYSTVDGDTFHMPIHQESEGQIFEINVAGVNRIWADSPNWANILEIRVAKIPKSIYYASYNAILDNMQKNGVTINAYEDNYLLGTFTNETDGILFLPMIQGRGWGIYVDGEWQPEIIINDAFAGIVVPAGTHELMMEFWNADAWGAYRNEIKWIAICVCFIIAGSIWNLIQKRKK